MYRVGFGDCFLLSIPTARVQSKEDYDHILVDCGVHSRGDIGTMEKVVTDISEITDKKLAVAIATHAHQDHISGFAKFGDVFSTFKVREVWLPWTWDENNKEALKIQRMQAAMIARLAQHFNAQGINANQDVLSAVENLNLSGNKQAVQLLKLGFGNVKTKVRYLKAGDSLDSEKISIPGLSARILGPPESKEFLAQMNPPKSQRYLRMVEGQTEVANAIHPFEQKWQVDRKTFTGIRLDAEEEEKLRNLASLSLDELAFALDQARNNESLVILFVIGSQHLLFAGDAQYGNWKWWLENAEFDDVLSKITFFKIAHHGSHNATPKSALEGMSDGEFAAMVSTQSKPWDVIPRDPLMARLSEKTKQRIVRSDWLPIEGAPKPTPHSKPSSPSALPKGFSKGDFWFDYVIKI
jgi:beta-lactamase superfamily II metal-dependent hydrolase